MEESFSFVLGTVTKQCSVLYLPPANEVWGKVIFLHLFVILFTGGVPGQVPCGQVHPPRPGALPLGRYTPRTRYTPPMQVHPQADTPPWDQVHPPGTRNTPRTRYTPRAGTPQTRYTSGPGTPPPGSIACWEIRATSGRYASYWNAFLFCIWPK